MAPKDSAMNSSSNKVNNSSLGSLGSMPPALEQYFHESMNMSNQYANASNRDDFSFAQGDPSQSRRDNSSYNDDDDDSDESLSEYGDDEGETENLQDKAAKATRQSLARGETKAVTCLRYLVLTVLLATAIGVSLATLFYSRSVEQDSFEAEFESVAVVTIRSFVEAVEHRLTAMDAMAAGMTSHALSSGETFPNVTVPDFEVKGATLRTQTDSIYSFWLPLVTDETRKGFEAYTKMKQGHMFQSYMAEEGLRQYQDASFGINKTETQATDQQAEETEAEAEISPSGGGARRELHPGPMEVHPTIHDEIWGFDQTGYITMPEGSGPYLPMWQVSPVIPNPSLFIFNFLAYYDLAPMMRQSLDTEKATLSYLQTNHTGATTEDLIRILLTLGQFRHEDVDYNADPMTQVSYPVFDTFNPITKKVSGIIVTTIFWRLLFANILPASVQGVICVLSNTLGDQATYRIDGRTATYLGKGDLHDPQYDDMAVTRDVAEYIKERSSIETTSFTSVELDGGYTSYRVHVYPSEDMEATYVTSNPTIYAIVVASVFVFTSLVFMCYDCLVEKRQRKVMDKAVKSTAVVTSLFPEAVHERLFDDGNKSEELDVWKAASNEFNSSKKSRGPSVNDIMGLRSSLRVESKTVSNISAVHKKKGRPIADKFPHVTVLFADLAGFTKWSSTREPDEVFVLLEALYGAFDKIALRRQVFKVETIGDCYMACTGLPKPQPDHAVRMVKFARDAQARMARLLDELQLSLGEDTKDLVMRIGLHSGPVTAGVLRGDKGRFQLFGDTVNTASRMESNGVKGRIHVSESTANLLPERWLSIREDKIVAKGKGEMTTYFVNPGLSGRSSIGGRSSVGGVSKHSSSLDTSSLDFEEEDDGNNPKLDAKYLNNLGIPFSEDNNDVDPFSVNKHRHNNNHIEREIIFEDEPVSQTIQIRPISPALFGKNVAQKLGITDEIEV